MSYFREASCEPPGAVAGIRHNFKFNFCVSIQAAHCQVFITAIIGVIGQFSGDSFRSQTKKLQVTITIFVYSSSPCDVIIFHPPKGWERNCVMTFFGKEKVCRILAMFLFKIRIACHKQKSYFIALTFLFYLLHGLLAKRVDKGTHSRQFQGERKQKTVRRQLNIHEIQNSFFLYPRWNNFE